MTKSQWISVRTAVVEAARELASNGLVSGSNGNVSVRIDQQGSPPLIAITPMGIPYSDLKDRDIVVCDYELDVVEGELVPSSESLLHVGIYSRREDVRAIVHTHPLHSGVMAVTGEEIPVLLDEMAVSLGGPVKVSNYAFPATQELADNVFEALGDRAAAIIRNHGAIGVGGDLRQALNACILTERVAYVFYTASLLGKVNPLPDDAVQREIAVYRMRRGLPSR